MYFSTSVVFFSNIFSLQLAESKDAEPGDTEGSL
jgi:hypothetical protein